MKVGLVGFGRAGKAVASVVMQNPETTLCWVVRRSQTLQHRSAPEFLGVSSSEPGLIYSMGEQPVAKLLEEMPVDVIIDFSAAEGIEYYGAAAACRGVAIVSAISAYPEATVELLHRLAEETRVLWSPNITIGVNFLILASKILKIVAPNTDIVVTEEHFRAKKEVSGTAKVIGSSLGVSEEQIKSIRAGGIVGRHEIIFGFPYQTVRLIHESIGREAFGNGAIFAAQHVVKQPHGLYTMEDFLIPYLSLVTGGRHMARQAGPVVPAN